MGEKKFEKTESIDSMEEEGWSNDEKKVARVVKEMRKTSSSMLEADRPRRMQVRLSKLNLCLKFLKSSKVEFKLIFSSVGVN